MVALAQDAALALGDVGGPPGAVEVGAPAELDAVELAYRRDGQFAILHDMTNCLRIGDVTIFGNDC